MVSNDGTISNDSNSLAVATLPVAQMIEDIIGCKWSLTILGLVRKNVRRPGAIERAISGLSTKVMNERLAKLTRYNILQRVSYPEVPPRVEYNLTAFGQKFVAILDAIEALENDGGACERAPSQSNTPKLPLEADGMR